MKRFYVQWHILDRCNFRCRHCYQDDFSKKRELGWDDLKKVADNLLSAMERWGAKLDVALTGGEPLLKEELKDLLNYLDSSERVGEIGIITNGTLLSEKIKDLKKIKKLKDIRISLDGITKETNDGLRGENAFSRVVDEIRKVKGSGIPLGIMFTVMKRNIHEVGRLDGFVRDLALQGYIIERFFPLGQGKLLMDEVLSGEEFLAAWRDILNAGGLSGAPEDLIPYRAIKVFVKGGRKRIYGARCIVGRDGMALLPDGTALPCRRFPLPLGNLMEKPLFTIWEESEILKLVREKRNLKGKCGECGVEGCFGCRAMSYCLTGDPLAEDPHCWLRGDPFKC